MSQVYMAGEDAFSERDNVISQYVDACSVHVPKLKAIHDGYIFDENKSVKWNREEVARQNQAIKKHLEICTHNKKEAIKEARENIISYLCKEYPAFSREQVNKVFEVVEGHFDTSIYDIVDGISMRLDYCEEILNIFAGEYK